MTFKKPELEIIYNSAIGLLSDSPTEEKRLCRAAEHFLRIVEYGDKFFHDVIEAGFHNLAVYLCKSARCSFSFGATLSYSASLNPVPSERQDSTRLVGLDCMTRLTKASQKINLFNQEKCPEYIIDCLS